MAGRSPYGPRALAVPIGMKILVVDDSSWQRTMLKRILREAGHTVVEAGNGREAIERLAELPEAIVCDLLMPVLDGFGLLAELKERGSGIPVVIASADVQRLTRERCAELGAADFLAKPYTPEQLVNAVGQLVRAEPTEC